MSNGIGYHMVYLRSYNILWWGCGPYVEKGRAVWMSADFHWGKSKFCAEKSGAKMAPQWNFLEKQFHFVKVEPFYVTWYHTEKKVEPKRLHPGALLEIVPRVELSYVPWNGSRDGAVLAPLFSQCIGTKAKNLTPLITLYVGCMLPEQKNWKPP